MNLPNDSWQGNNQNPIFQASQNDGAEHLMKMSHFLNLAIALQDRYIDRIMMILPTILAN
ncbi:MAG: hypothetical protein V7K92_24135 [Nostoc sp.]|uniref:hypothetical protein n=1 Tax=Nostoc sp. TaxID=1180 RepID=UPI002FF1F952